MKHSIIRRFLPLALALMVFFSISKTNLRGYVTDGHAWATSQVLYYINPQNIFLSDTAAISAIQTGALGWTAQTLANVQLVYAGNTNGSSVTYNSKNEVFFRNDGSGYLGETYTWADLGTGHLLDADVIFHETYQLFTGSGCSGTGIYLEDNAIHEFGHVLGLLHTSVAGATMQPAMPSACDMTQMTLESDDIAGIESLYPPTGSKVINTAPTVSVVSPLNGAAYGASASIWFGGSASDAQDGNLTPWLTWTSSQDGSLGTGGSFSRTLSAGSHVITASVTDKGGLSASTQVSLTVAADTTPIVTSPTLSLTVNAYKVRRLQKANVWWAGFNSAYVDIYRNGAVIVTTGNDGFYTDAINQRGSASYTYQVCGGEPYTCSDSVTIQF